MFRHHRYHQFLQHVAPAEPRFAQALRESLGSCHIPEPRHAFENAFRLTDAPWRRPLFLLWQMITAGRPKADVKRLLRELEAWVDTHYADDERVLPWAAINREETRLEGAQDEAQVVACLEPSPANLDRLVERTEALVETEVVLLDRARAERRRLERERSHPASPPVLRRVQHADGPSVA